MSEQSYTVEQYAADLKKIAADTSDEDEIISRVAPLAQRLALDKSWVKPEYYETNPEQGFELGVDR